MSIIRILSTHHIIHRTLLSLCNIFLLTYTPRFRKLVLVIHLISMNGDRKVTVLELKVRVNWGTTVALHRRFAADSGSETSDPLTSDVSHVDSCVY